MATVTRLMTAAEFGNLPDPGHPQELVRGVIVNMPPPKSRHGQVCGRVTYLLMTYAEQHQLGHVLSNDSGVITEQNPDTVRGADVCFYGYKKVPPGPLPSVYLDVPPDTVFEVLSPSDRWPDVHQKIAEYLHLGVSAVYVLDPKTSQVHAYFSDSPGQVLTVDDEFVGVGPLTGLRIPVERFFA